jgi:PAS domain S-box-containing protein
MAPAAADLIQTSLLGEAIDNGPVAVLVADDQMRYVAVNQFACEWLGYTREELLQLTVNDLAPFPETPREYVEVIVGSMQSGEHRLRHKDGRDIPTGFRAGATKVAGLTFYIAVFWALDES